MEVFNIKRNGRTCNVDKLEMHTRDLTEENFKKLAALFPNAVTETAGENGEIVRAIDADVLRQEISAEVVEGAKERYQFNWPDKKKSVVLANAPVVKTLRLSREKSAGRDGTPGSIDTENIYIEGDNLDALKLLQETYLGKVKMVYIDPPYNTGGDAFVYDDAFDMEGREFEAAGGYRDGDGNWLVDRNSVLKQNNEGNGRFHTDWLNMIYPRLRLARDLLADDGIIFISIDDNEQENLKKICDEIFGSSNFINTFIWQRNSSGKTEKDKFTVNTEYIVLYAKSNQCVLNDVYKPLSKSTQAMYSKDDNDGRGRYRLYPLQKPAAPGPETSYDYVDNNGKVWACPPKGWRMKYEKLKALENDDRLCLDNKSLSEKAYWNERDSEGKRVDTLWNDLPENTSASKDVQSIFKATGVFNNPKPVELVSRCINISSKDALVLDFFSGSATTAHAVMQLNAEDGGNRKFIMVQLPEVTAEKSEARKAGYDTICDIGEERIRRAAKKIKEETNADIDYGFRVFKVDSSNMKDVYYRPQDLKQEEIVLLADNIKEDRTPEDLLFQVMLDLGILLSSKIEEKSIAGKRVFTVEDGCLIACFDKDVTEEVVTAIAKEKPFYAVFRDSGMATDALMANFEQIFETHSPQTVRKVL